MHRSIRRFVVTRNLIDAVWHHAAISVRNMERALAFYRDILGFEVDWDMDHRGGEAMEKVVGLPDPDAHMVMLKGYGTRIELFLYHRPEGASAGEKRQCDFGLTHLAFQVRGIVAIHERLAATGVPFNSPPQRLRPGVWATYLRDPEGNTIELVQYQEKGVTG
jgi:catechol 2,3-dioxygenase-like lactoylglutathione lyase family enzyme